jgi:hypothetical protein
LKIEVLKNLSNLVNSKLEELQNNRELENETKISDLTDTANKIKENNTKILRLRIINKKQDADKIIKNDLMPIKKLITENPSKILIEFLEKEENLKDNQIQLYLLERNSENKTYRKKLNFIITAAENNQILSDNLYNNVRFLYGKTEITLAKYSKYYYEWEIIPEFDEKGPINLKKSNFNLKDGDWIAVRNDSLLENNKKDDFSTEEDKKVLIFSLYDFNFYKITLILILYFL